jgi:hypothetical protein
MASRRKYPLGLFDNFQKLTEGGNIDDFIQRILKDFYYEFKPSVKPNKDQKSTVKSFPIYHNLNSF